MKLYSRLFTRWNGFSVNSFWDSHVQKMTWHWLWCKLTHRFRSFLIVVTAHFLCTFHCTISVWDGARERKRGECVHIFSTALSTSDLHLSEPKTTSSVFVAITSSHVNFSSLVFSLSAVPPQYVRARHRQQLPSLMERRTSVPVRKTMGTEMTQTPPVLPVLHLCR